MACRASSGGFPRGGVKPGRVDSPFKVGVVTGKQQLAVKSARVSMAYSASVASSSVCCWASLYQVLSVPPKASAHDLKSAYRRLALRYHPDVCPPAEKEECSRMFVKIRAAYETLSDPILRQDYDWRIQNKLDFSDSEGSSQINSTNVWEDQLAELIRRSNCSSEYTWGGRMRRRNQQTPSAAI